MARILIYSSPSRGHLYPLVPVLSQLVERGHNVFARAASTEVRLLQDIGTVARPLAESVEFAIRRDWEQNSYDDSIRNLLTFLVERTSFEAEDIDAAIKKHHPDLILTDAACLGACTVAELSGVPWLSWGAELMPFPAQGIPNFGPGLALKSGVFGAFKNFATSNSIQRVFDTAIEEFNDFRVHWGARQFFSFLDWPSSLAELLYFTAEPFEYSRQWPSSVHLVGPSTWEPADLEKITIEQDARPIILISCATEFQNDVNFVNTALKALDSSIYQIIVTTAANDSANIEADANVKVVRLASHNHILDKAACVICSGGLGLVQRALCKGVPVCLVPHFRDQFELGARLTNLNVGTVVPQRQLSVAAIEKNVKKAINCKGQALVLQEQLQLIDSAQAAANVIEAALTPTEQVL